MESPPPPSPSPSPPSPSSPSPPPPSPLSSTSPPPPPSSSLPILPLTSSSLSSSSSSPPSSPTPPSPTPPSAPSTAATSPSSLLSPPSLPPSSLSLLLKIDNFSPSPRFIALFVVLALLYSQAMWALSAVVSIFEPRWGIGVMRRSGDLVIARVGVEMCFLYWVCVGGLGFASYVPYEWRSADRARSVAGNVVLSGCAMAVLLYRVTGNVAVYMYCKAVKGELALEIAEEFANEYVSLPFADDGKVPTMPHLVSVADVA